MPPTGYAADFQDLGGLALRDAIPALADRLGVSIEAVVGALAQTLGGTFDEVWTGLASAPDQTLGQTLGYAAELTGRTVDQITGAWQSGLGIEATPTAAQQPGAIAFESTDLKDEQQALTGETRLEGRVPGVASSWYINALADALPDDLGQHVRIESDGRGLVRLTVPTSLKARLVQELGKQNWLGIQQAGPRDYAGKLEPFRWAAPLSAGEDAALQAAIANKTLPSYLAPYATELQGWTTLPPDQQWRLAAIMARDLLAHPSAYGASPATVRGAMVLITRYRGELARRGLPTTGWEPGSMVSPPAGGGGPAGGGTPPAGGGGGGGGGTPPASPTEADGIAAGLTQALGRPPTPAELASATAVLAGFREHYHRDPTDAEAQQLQGDWVAFTNRNGRAPSVQELAAWVMQGSPGGRPAWDPSPGDFHSPPTLGTPAAAPTMPTPAYPVPVASTGLVAGTPPTPEPAAAPTVNAPPVATPLPTLGTGGATGIAGPAAGIPPPGLAAGLPPLSAPTPRATPRPRGL